MGRIKADIASTNKPQGGYVRPERPYDPKEDLTDLMGGKFNGLHRLIEHFKEPDLIITPQGSSAMMACLVQGSLGEARRLLAAGANPDKNPHLNQDCTYIGLILRQRRHSWESPMLAAFLEADANPNSPVDSTGDTPLIYCAKNALLGQARQLAMNGADPGKRGSDGLDALDWALRLPEAQRALMLFSLYPPPLKLHSSEEEFFQRLETAFDPETLEWISQSWRKALT